MDPTSARDVLVYDGDCGFCQWLTDRASRWVRPVADFTPWQRADLERLGLTADECVEAVRWVGRDGRVAAGPVAVARALRGATGPAGWAFRALGWLLERRMVLPVAWPVYRWVANRRHLMPGGTAACALPPPPQGPSTG
ncbi:thiol-disulfide oxidoreductase DCC family protein [Pilimelia columellifera]|uniref:DUF393 domain-containing protein n=1 Tax=Pilimelia columellifera subsp. columellifera TaxID=706583 RepID=A0ABN3NFT8_9ACTN